MMKMSSTKSKKIILLTVIIISALIALIIPFSILEHQNVYGGTRTCPAQITDASLIDYNGFLFNTVQNKGGHGKIPGLNEFLLMPGFTGYLTMNYDFSSNGSIKNVFENFYHTTPSKFFSDNLNHVWKSSGANHNFDSLSTDKVGLHIFVSNVNSVNDHILQVTYVIKADASAERGTYLIGIYQTCPGEILTVGYWPYLG